MFEKNKKPGRLTSREELLGRFLLRDMNKETKKTECPDVESIAALIDGALSQKEKEGVMEHIGSCVNCYELYSETIKTELRPSVETWKKNKKAIFRYFPLAFAVAALLLLVLKITLRQEPGNEFPPISQRVISLAQKVKGEAVVSLMEEPSSTAFAFGDKKLFPQGALIQTGVYLTDIEIFLALKDRERLLRVLEKSLLLLQTMEDAKKITNFYKDYIKKVKDGASFQQLIGKPGDFPFKDKATLFFISFGKWLEGGRIAASLKYNDFFHKDDVLFFRKKTENDGLPKGFLKSLEAIEEITSKELITENDYERLEKEFYNITFLFSLNLGG